LGGIISPVIADVEGLGWYREPFQVELSCKTKRNKSATNLIFFVVSHWEGIKAVTRGALPFWAI
jgi:hypothetical protein